MTFETLTPNGIEIVAPDMDGKMSEPFVPFCVRVPDFIELNDGTLLYFFEMKYTSQADEAPGCRAMMRSHDGGKTWGEMVLLRRESGYGVGVPVYDAVHDTIVSLGRSRHWKPGMEEDHILNEWDQICGKSYERFWMTKSTDGGLTWSEHKEIFIDTPADWTIQHCGTPAIGIQLKHQKDASKNGRLLIPVNRASMNAEGKNEFRAHILISDDFGDTWRIGGLEDYVGANESALTELSDGTVVYNCRNQGGQPENLRIQSYSYDGGETLEGSGVVETLYDPICHAGFTSACVDGKDYIFLTAPSGERGGVSNVFGTPTRWGKREKLMLYISADGGKTYKAVKQISEEGIFAAYSALHVTREGKLLCAWESGPKFNDYRDIHYSVFDVNELIELCK